ncbi:MAG: alpha-N-acetylglucosaminidase [Ruminococcaceae bacterium]|nr:alpha-N-acetylglucosaminidase [Oscillospiraceae bacterium]
MRTGLQSVYDLIERTMQQDSQNFELELCCDSRNCDFFDIKKADGKVLICANNVNSLCMGFGYFIKRILHEDISWSNIDNKITYRDVEFADYHQEVKQTYRSYMNFCTHSYSSPWWNWERWQKEIDIMAMNGINMPLSITGSEAIWYYTLLKIGYSDEEARQYLVGPAFLAWQFMGNIESFSGPLPKSWIDEHLKLGKQIMERQISLGMKPIQQGFTGCVPISFMERYPKSNIQLKKHWNNISCTAQLDPTDEIFWEIGSIYMETMNELFGLHGYYAADPFHEGHPPVDGDEYLNKVGLVIKQLMKSFDEDYVWVMQAWSFREKIAMAVEKEHLIILDLVGENAYNKSGFYGYRFINGTLHNFGGRMNLHGDVDRLCKNQYKLLLENYDNIVGTGLFMEGIGQNPLYYDLAFDTLTAKDAINLDEWIKEFAQRRYKNDSEEVVCAIRKLIDTVYTPNSDDVLKCASLICARPSLHAKGSGPSDSFDESYDNRKLFEVAKAYSQISSTTAGFKYDKHDILRQTLSNYALKLYKEVIECFEQKNINDFRNKAARFNELLEDIDELLYQIPQWRMQKWIDDAVSFATNEEEAKLYEYNAREQVTIWGNEEECILFDYAWKEWAGLISEYYGVRWAKFFDMLLQKLEKGEDYSEEGLEEFENRIVWKANDFRCELAKWEAQWVSSNERLRTYEVDDTIFNKLLDKYEIWI